MASASESSGNRGKSGRMSVHDIFEKVDAKRKKINERRKQWQEFKEKLAKSTSEEEYQRHAAEFYGCLVGMRTKTNQRHSKNKMIPLSVDGLENNSDDVGMEDLYSPVTDEGGSEGGGNK